MVCLHQTSTCPKKGTCPVHFYLVQMAGFHSNLNTHADSKASLQLKHVKSNQHYRVSWGLRTKSVLFCLPTESEHSSLLWDEQKFPDHLPLPFPTPSPQKMCISAPQCKPVLEQQRTCPVVHTSVGAKVGFEVGAFKIGFLAPREVANIIPPSRKVHLGSAALTRSYEHRSRSKGQ